MNKDLIKKYTAEVYDEIVGYRRHLHAHPELSAHEKETTKYLASIMEENSIRYTLNPAGEGLIARIQGSKPGKVLAFRGDIDALPIPEETGLPFASENPGLMHACGHDCHMAILLAFGLVMARHPELVEGTVVLIFQPSEEKFPGGASPMIKTGLLDDVEAYYGYHVAPELKTGEIGCNDGPVMASPTTFWIDVKGKAATEPSPRTRWIPSLSPATSSPPFRPLSAAMSTPVIMWWSAAARSTEAPRKMSSRRAPRSWALSAPTMIPP